jgi:hypothetical protein
VATPESLGLAIRRHAMLMGERRFGQELPGSHDRLSGRPSKSELLRRLRGF